MKANFNSCFIQEIKALIQKEIIAKSPCLNGSSVENYPPIDVSEVKGLSNQNLMFYNGSQKFLAIFFANLSEKKALGLSARRHINNLKKLVAHDFTPKVLFCNHNYALLTWIAGTSLDRIKTFEFNDIFLTQLALTIQKVHSTPLTTHTISLKKTYSTLFGSIDSHRHSSSLLRFHKKMLNANYPKKSAYVFDHMDIHLGNIIQSGKKLFLIDWEYSGNVEKNFAFCNLFNALNLNESQKIQFLSIYYGAALHPKAHQKKSVYCKLQEISQWQIWYDYLIYLWYEVRWNQTRDLQYLDYLTENKIYS